MSGSPSRDHTLLEARLLQIGYLNLDMPTTSLAGNVQESKAQRLERLKSRFRNRGGCVRLLPSFAYSWMSVRLTHSST